MELNHRPVVYKTTALPSELLVHQVHSIARRARRQAKNEGII